MSCPCPHHTPIIHDYTENNSIELNSTQSTTINLCWLLRFWIFICPLDKMLMIWVMENWDSTGTIRIQQSEFTHLNNGNVYEYVIGDHTSAASSPDKLPRAYSCRNMGCPNTVILIRFSTTKEIYSKYSYGYNYRAQVILCLLFNVMRRRVCSLTFP